VGERGRKQVGATLLILRSEGGTTEMLDWLKANGCYVNHHNRDLCAVAAARGSIEILEWLLDTLHSQGGGYQRKTP